jgi:hypothetical protein
MIHWWQLYVSQIAVSFGLILCLLPEPWASPPGGEPLILEEFSSADGDGFPLNWENESAHSGARARQAYQVKTETGEGFLAIKDADQRIKKKKIDWDPKSHPLLMWRWRLHKADLSTNASGPIAVMYVSLDTDLLFIPVFTKYVWSPTKPEGTVTEGGMFSGTEVVVQSGNNPLGQWVEERVNVYEDFKRIHGHEPAEKAWGISLLAGPGIEIDFGHIVAAPASSASSIPAGLAAPIPAKDLKDRKDQKDQ